MPYPAIRKFAGIAIVVAIALVIAWGTSSYYGERRIGQEEILRKQAAVSSYTRFAWPMDNIGELILDPRHIGSPRVAKHVFSFRLVDDTYFALNMQGRILTPDYHFLISLEEWNTMPDGRLVVYLHGRTDSGAMGMFASEPLVLKPGRSKHELDLDKLVFGPTDGGSGSYRWGKQILSADSLRFDWDGPAGSQVVVYNIQVRPGLRIAWTLADLFAGAQKQGIASVARELRLSRGERDGWFISAPLGVGTIDSFLDLVDLRADGSVAWSIRSGSTDSLGTWNWSDWITPAEDGMIADLPAAPFFQVRLDMKRAAGSIPTAESFAIRLLDNRPPGTIGPFSGSGQIPYASRTFLRDYDESPRESGEWIRLPFGVRDFDRWVEELTARDITIVASADINRVSLARLMATAQRYRTRILFWELIPGTDITGTEMVDLFQRFREALPRAVLFPQKIDGDYFRDLALSGVADIAKARGTSEENLDRGFGWYFVIALIGILLVVALGPVIGYNFRFGKKAALDTLACLAVSAVVIIPLMQLVALGGLTMPRDLAQIQVAAGRFVLSSFVQEFLRAIALLLAVRYLMQKGQDEKKAWLYSILFSSLLFGLGHLGYPGFSLWEVIGFVIITTVFGIILSLYFRRSRSLVVISIVHFIANIFFATMTTFGPRF